MVPLKEPLPAWVKVPMVAMSKFLLLRATTAAASMAIGEAGMIGRAPLAAEAQRRMATRGFFVSRCKAEGGGKAARRRCARPIKAKPAPVRSSQSRGRAVVAEPEILRRGYDGHRQSEGIRFFAGPRQAHLASNPSQRLQESERR
jgi:hypothetical protein